jgi:hypothetical protein
MIKITITAEAFDAISRRYRQARAHSSRFRAGGLRRFIWLTLHVVNKLRYLRGPGESYGEVIIRIAAQERRVKPRKAERRRDARAAQDRSRLSQPWGVGQKRVV